MNKHANDITVQATVVDADTIRYGGSAFKRVSHPSAWGHVADLNPVDGVECPSCRFLFVVEEFETDEDGMIIDDVMLPYVPNVCPRCGRPIPYEIKECA